MTKEEADRRVALAEKVLVATVRERYLALDATGTPIGSALRELQEAEQARAALDKPKLRTRRQCVSAAFPNWGEVTGLTWSALAMLEMRDREILMLIEKLPRYNARGEPSELNGNKIEWTHGESVLLSDLRRLIEGGSA